MLKKSDLFVAKKCALNFFKKVLKEPFVFEWFVFWGNNHNSTAETASQKGVHFTSVNFEVFSKVDHSIAELKNTLMHELIHVFLFEKIGIPDNHNKEFESIRQKLNKALGYNGVKKDRVIDEKGKFKNPTLTKKQKAVQLFKDFNHYNHKRIIQINIPISANTYFLKLGEVDNLEYISDKAIFESDQKTLRRKVRTYIHNFSEHNKAPLLLTNQEGNILIIYDPKNKIEVKKEGIV